MYELVRASYDRVATRYAEELCDELAGKPLDRALLDCLGELATSVDRGELPATVGDLGCGPGHVAAYLAGRGVPTVGIDISPAMIDVARRRYPDVPFRLGSLLALPVADGELAAAVALYSIIHLRPEDRLACYQELRRAITPGGWLLLAFHVSVAGREPGEIMHAEQWWGEPVDLDFYYLDPAEVIDGLCSTGFAIMSRVDREPWHSAEHQSKRCFLLARRT